METSDSIRVDSAMARQEGKYWPVGRSPILDRQWYQQRWNTKVSQIAESGAFDNWHYDDDSGLISGGPAAGENQQKLAGFLSVGTRSSSDLTPKTHRSVLDTLQQIRSQELAKVQGKGSYSDDATFDGHLVRFEALKRSIPGLKEAALSRAFQQMGEEETSLRQTTRGELLGRVADLEEIIGLVETPVRSLPPSPTL